MVRAVVIPEGLRPGLHHRARRHAQLKPEFDRGNCKIIGVSVDLVEDHARWSRDIEETQGHAPNYPMIGDRGLAVAML